MKTQTLLMTLVVLIAGPTFAAGDLFAPTKISQSSCDYTQDQDLSVTIHCVEENVNALKQLNDNRIAVLARDSRLKAYGLQTETASVTAYRGTTEADKKIFCSLKYAPNPMGGRVAAWGNRQCYLDQELKLEKQLIGIKQLFDETVRGFQEQ